MRPQVSKQKVPIILEIKFFIIWVINPYVTKSSHFRPFPRGPDYIQKDARLHEFAHWATVTKCKSSLLACGSGVLAGQLTANVTCNEKAEFHSRSPVCLLWANHRVFSTYQCKYVRCENVKCLMNSAAYLHSAVSSFLLSHILNKCRRSLREFPSCSLLFLLHSLIVLLY